MAGRTTTFRLRGMRTWVDNIKNTVSEEAAKRIVTDLQEYGPYWSGEFHDNWVVVLGDKNIPANKAGNPTRLAQPKERSPKDIPVPKIRGGSKTRKSVTYTIGNRMEYRDAALDLVPMPDGILRGDHPRQTSPLGRDWYVTYAEAELANVLREVTGRVAKDPKIKGFKSQ